MTKNNNSFIITIVVEVATTYSLPITLSLPSSVPATLASLLFLDHQAHSHLRAFALAVSFPWNSSQTICQLLPSHIQFQLKCHLLREALLNHPH